LAAKKPQRLNLHETHPTKNRFIISFTDWLSFCALLASKLFKRRSSMDRWLNAPPALAYVSEIHTWVALNKYSEPISWTNEAKEIAWLSEWVSGKKCESEPPKPNLSLSSNHSAIRSLNDGSQSTIARRGLPVIASSPRLAR